MSQFTPPPSPAPQGSTKLVVIALIIAAAAVVLVNVYIGVLRKQAQTSAFTVYRLKQSVRPGDKLTDRHVEAVAVPEDFQSAFSNAVDPTGLETRLGEIFRRPADRADVLTYDLFLDPDENELDRRISRDMRLVALPVNPRRLPATLRPGMFVDIEAPFPSTGVPNVLPVMERVRVMAVGSHSVIDEATSEGKARLGSYSTISIEVTPSQATQLSKIAKAVTGDFEIQLRNPGDHSTPKIPTGGLNPEVLQLIEPGRISTGLPG